LISFDLHFHLHFDIQYVFRVPLQSKNWGTLSFFEAILLVRFFQTVAVLVKAMAAEEIADLKEDAPMLEFAS
jgi:hypothetical protein